MLRLLQEPDSARVRCGDIRRMCSLHFRPPRGGLARYRGSTCERTGPQDHELHRAAIQGGVEALRSQYRPAYGTVPGDDDTGFEDAEAGEEVNAHGSLGHGVRDVLAGM